MFRGAPVISLAREATTANLGHAACTMHDSTDSPFSTSVTLAACSTYGYLRLHGHISVESPVIISRNPVLYQIIKKRLQGVPKAGIGNNIFMPIFCPSPRTKLKLLCTVEKVVPFYVTLLCHIPMTYNLKKGACRC